MFFFQVDAEGPLVRLKNLLFNQETLLTIAQWVTVTIYTFVLSPVFRIRTFLIRIRFRIQLRIPPFCGNLNFLILLKFII